MKFLSDRYTKVLTHKGIDICTLKSACPSDGDSLGYVIDHPHFNSCVYNHPEDAQKAIEQAENANKI